MHKVRRVKEPTASTFVFHHSPGEWHLGLIHHPRLSAWMLPGGHVEPDENAAEAALREVREETGLTVRLLPGPAVPLPTDFPHGAVPTPWWVVELTAAPDRHTPAPHVHIDHLYVAVADTEDPAGDPAHPFAWFTATELMEASDVAPDSRLQAAELFGRIGDLAD